MQRIICCHHKVGTVLLGNVFSEIARSLGLSFLELYGTQSELPADPDIVLLAHSGFDLRRLHRPIRAVHVVRDPRDVLVSGYLYHKRCTEYWCVNRDLSLVEPILFPRVPYSQQHRTEAWKRRYLIALGGRSYQDNLRSFGRDRGIFFELDNYAGWTIENMLEWRYDLPSVMEINFEQLHQEFDTLWQRMFWHLNLIDLSLKTDSLLSIARSHDLNRMSPNDLKRNHHVSPGRLTKWPEYLTSSHLHAIDERFPRIRERLGYS